MCLWKNDEATEKFRKKNKKMVVVWKTYTVYAYDDTAYSPYMNNVILLFPVWMVVIGVVFNSVIAPFLVLTIVFLMKLFLSKE